MSTFNPPLRAYYGKDRVMVLAEHVTYELDAWFTIVFHDGPRQGEAAVVADSSLKFLPFFWSEITPRYDMGDDPQDPEIIPLSTDAPLLRLTNDD